MAYSLTVDGHLLVVNPALDLEAWNYVAPPVAAPTNLRQTAATSSTISLAFDAVVGTYTLERATVTNGTVGAFSVLTSTLTVKTYQDAGLPYMSTYAYRVKVTVNGVTSPYSPVRQATTANSGAATPDTYTATYRATY